MSKRKKNIKVCLLGASFNTGNMGVAALTAGAIKCILHQFPNAEIFLLDYSKKKSAYHVLVQGKTVPIRLLDIRFSKKVYLKNNIALLISIALIAKFIPFQKIRRKIIASNFHLGRLSEADIIASIAGGDSFSDIYGMARFFYVSLPQLLILFMGKKLSLLPQTLGPFTRWPARVIARHILRRANIVYSRDYSGIPEMEHFLGSGSDSKKLKFCYDVGFVMDPVKPARMDLDDFFEKHQSNAAVVGLNISGLLFRGGYKHDNMFGLRVNYQELVDGLINFFVQEKGAAVLLVPHVFGSGLHSESDATICETIYAALKPKFKDAVFLARGSYDQGEIKHIIGLCDFFVGARMHACIAALSQNIPAVAISYSKKFIGVLQTLGFESLVADPRELSKEEIMALVARAFEQRNLLSGKLETKMPQVRETVLGLFREISEFQKIND